MASLINPIAAKMKLHLVANTALTAVSVGYRAINRNSWPAAFIMFDGPGDVRDEMNSTRDIAYPVLIGVESTTFEMTNDILETILTMWEVNPLRAELAALGVIAIDVLRLAPGGEFAEVSDGAGFRGEIDLVLTIRHNF